MGRVFAAVLSSLTGLFILTGCGPKFTGRLNPDGNGIPQPAPGQAYVSTLNPSSVVAGASNFTLTVTGANFTQTTVIIWDSTNTLTTTYVSSTVLQAQIPASLFTKPGTIFVAVTPTQSLNFGANFTITPPPLAGNSSYTVSMIPAAANDMVLDPSTQQIYLSLAAADSTHPNTVTSLDPQTGKPGASSPASAEPHRLSVSGDGSFLYAGLDSAGTIERLTLPALQSNLSIPLGSYSSSSVSYGSEYPIDIAADPASPHTIAVSRGVMSLSPHELGGISLFDDATPRANSIAGFSQSAYNIDRLLWNPGGQTLYGLDTESSGGGLYSIAVDPSGLQFAPAHQPLASIGGQGLHFDPTTGYLYSDYGAVIDPNTGSTIATFPLQSVQGGFNSNVVMVPDGKLNIAYFVGHVSYIPAQNSYVIEAYDLTHLTFLGAASITNVSGTPNKILRWGSNGLAILTGDSYGRGTPGDGVYLISGAFVTSPSAQ